jgi:solute carrier family 10 (sodium/bile acid cotransporter), member 7
LPGRGVAAKIEPVMKSVRTEPPGGSWAGRAGRHWFLAGLLATTALAFLIPEVGARGGPLRPEISSKAGVAVIFFLQGLSISPAALGRGAMRWPLHLTMQLFIFAAFPVAGLLLVLAAGGFLAEDLRTGFLFLAVLPTTISTGVVLTATAGGNVSGALFNAVLANVAGVVLTPLLVALLLGVTGETPGVLPMIREVAGLLLVPLLVGQAMRPLLLQRMTPSPRVMGAMSNLIILFIIFTALASSVHSGAFAQSTPLQTAAVLAGVVILFTAATAAVVLLGRSLGFDAGDRIALLFCAPQKTLAAGAPMGQVLFAGHPGIGLILLPLLVYHIAQLLAGAAMAGRMADRR